MSDGPSPSSFLTPNPLNSDLITGKIHRAVAVVVHGLNNKPEAMDPLRQHLQKQKMETVLVRLAGHRGEALSDLTAIHRQTWLDDMDRAYQIAKAVSERENIPLILIGYSLGALISLDHWTENLFKLSEPKYKKLVFFAPSFSLRFYVHAFRMFRPWPNLCISSLAPQRYRASETLPIAMYNALFDSLKKTQKKLSALRDLGQIQWINQSALLFIDPQDELVSFRGLKQFISKNHLDHWQLQPITSQGEYHHLIIDEASLGEISWQKVLACLGPFLDREAI